jgi:hypothetical protein
MSRIQHYLGVMFQCCKVYRRIYINKTGTAYEGSCPRCGRLARVPIRAGGSKSRFFQSG